MADAKTEVDKVSLEGAVAEWFSQRGMRISNMEVKAVGSDGDWEIGAATRHGGPNYDGLAREAEGHLRPKYKLVRFEVRRLETPPADAEPVRLRRRPGRSVAGPRPLSPSR